MDLAGKKAFVTGASEGLGRQIARALAAAGYDVALSSHTGDERVRTVASDVADTGRNGVPVAFDQGDATSIEAVVDKVVDHLGGLDILVNNAAVAKGVAFSDLDGLNPDLWDWTMVHNSRGPWLLAHAAAPHLARSGTGRIVNVAAMAGLRPMGASIAQSVSKAGIIQLTRCLAVALAPKVTVNCVAPGLMEGTVLTRNLTEEFRKSFTSPAALNSTTSLGDVADQIVQFCRADTITGQTLVIDGGIHFH